MSMFIVSENCINDVANLIVKLYPYMDLKDVFNKLIHLNCTVWNEKYGGNESIESLGYKLIDYSEFSYTNKDGLRKFKDGYYNIQITQLIESLSCYHYQIEENYIDNFDDKMTSLLINDLYSNPLIKEIKDFIQYNSLNDVGFYSENDNGRIEIKGVEWNR